MWIRTAPCACLLGVVVAGVLWTMHRVDGDERKLEQGPHGIAARYPGDVGIERDEAVLLVERFDGPMEALLARWEDICGKENFSRSKDVPKHAASRQSLLMTHVGGGSSRNHLYKRLPKGQDRVFARFYVKFAPDCQPVHHFGTHVGGNNPAVPWPDMKAGTARPGDKHFNVAIEPFGKAWRWDYYAYWHEMRGSPPRGQSWGNSFIRDPKLEVVRGEWICIEFMIQMNRPGTHDGELALWIDGKLVSHLGPGFPKGTWTFDKFAPNSRKQGVTWDHAKGGRRAIRGGMPFEGFSWRTTDELDIDYVWISLYMTGIEQGLKSRVWFDQVVVATEYIGPIQKAKRQKAND